MKFYVASSFQNMQKVRILSSKLEEIGLQQTYDWTQNEKTVINIDLREIGIKEKEAVKGCDLFILLLPGGKGSHTELGIAIGSGVKKIYIYTPDSVSEDTLATTFYHLPEVEIFSGAMGELVERVVGL